MACILNIETATRVCSVGLSVNAQIVSLREDHSQQYSHSTLLTGFIEKVMDEAGKNFADLDAIAVSMGPGSYTGLRIGVSAAKGLCYGLDIPLMALGTLDILAQLATAENEKYCFVIPLIDARRMEVYSAVYDENLHQVRTVQAEIINENSFGEYLSKGKVLFCGDGASKCTEVLKNPNAVFLPQIYPSAKGMSILSEQKFGNNQFEDVAYFEPFYLKDFVAGKPNVKGLQ